MAEPTVRKPRSLHTGARLALIAPSRPGTPERIERTTSYLRERGFHVVEPPLTRADRSYDRSDDAARAAEIVSCLNDDAIDGLLCVRGGYGSGRLLDLIDYDAAAAASKVLVGFSDTTALNLALYERSRLVTFSGAVSDLDLARETGPDELAESSLWTAVMSSTQIGTLPLEAERVEVIRAGRARGPLVPATLALLCSLVGTPYMPDLSGCVLLVEDVNEEPYRIDRMLNQLRLAGVLNSLAGLVLGQFLNCFRDDADWPCDLSAMVSDLTSQIPDMPVLCGVPYGHVKRRLVLPVGVMSELNTESATPSMEILETATIP